MERLRFKEELALIKQEMASLMSFYKDHVIVQLKTKKDLLNYNLNCKTLIATKSIQV